MVTWTAARWWCWAMITHKSKENRSSMSRQFVTLENIRVQTADATFFIIGTFLHLEWWVITWHDTLEKNNSLKSGLTTTLTLPWPLKKSLDWKPYQNLTWKERCYQIAHLRPKIAKSFSGWTTVKWEIVLQVAVSYYADLQMTQLITRLSWNDPWSTPHHLAAKCVPPYLLLSSCCFHKQQLTFMHGTTHFILRLLNEDKQRIWC